MLQTFHTTLFIMYNNRIYVSYLIDWFRPKIRYMHDAQICFQARRINRLYFDLSEAISACFTEPECLEETQDDQDDDRSDSQDHALDTSQLITLINQAEEGIT